MKKLAIFVEGATEGEFVEKLLEEVAGANKLTIEYRAISGGGRAPRSIRTIRAANHATGRDYYILIFDCGGDQQVKTRIVEEHENLSRTGYSQIIGIRDVRPQFGRADVPKLEMGLRTRVKTSLVPVDFVLSIMELEAWFLAEETHYSRIDPAITVAAIKAGLGFDVATDDLSIRGHPAKDLDDCYKIGGKTYAKGPSNPTIAALDFAHLYTNVRSRVPYLDRLLAHIDYFLT